METIELIRHTAAGASASAAALLHDETNGGPCRARYAPGSGTGETVDEVITLAMEGTAEEIDALVSRITSAIEEGLREKDTPGGVWAYLRVRAAAGATLYRSKVLGGRLEMASGVDRRAGGTQAARLHITRVNYWEEHAERYAALQGAPVSGDTALLEGFEEYSPGIPATLAGGGQAVMGDLPAPAHITVRSTGAALTPFTVFVMETRQDWDMHTLSAITHRAGASGTQMNDASCVEGSYHNLTWTGSGEVEAVQVDAARQSSSGAQWQGRPYRLVVRLGDVISTASSEATYARWRLYLYDVEGEYYLFELGGAMLPQNEMLVLGPVVNLPPWAPQNLNNIGIRLVGLLQAAGSGSHTIRFDAAFFAPVDGGWRIYRPALGSMPGHLEDDPYTGQLVNYAGYQTHNAEGPGLWVYPWMNQHFHFFFQKHETNGSKSAAVGEPYEVTVRYRPRKRVL